MMKIIKSLGIALLIFLQSMAANSNSYVRGSQYMLNQLGYAAGTEDGIKGKNTIEALTKYYADNNKVFDGIIDDNEFILERCDWSVARVLRSGGHVKHVALFRELFRCWGH